MPRVTPLLSAALLAVLLAAGPAAAARDVGATCARIAEAARAARLPPAYLARLIWTESRFDPLAVSPKGAQGVAQFMPETAARRGLADPFDRDAAIAASARYLADLRRRFGNLGLAAAAYNSGEARVARWLARGGRLPDETEAYVRAVTGMPADWFRRRGREAPIRALAPGLPFAEGCAALPRRAARARARWGVVLGASLTESAARRFSARLARDYAPLFAPYRVGVHRNPHRRRGAWWVGVAVERWSEAVALCDRLRARRGACRVVER